MAKPAGTHSNAGVVFVAMVLVVLFALISTACTGGSGELADQRSDAELPRFEEATGAVAELVGQAFEASSLPVELGGGAVDALTGSVILNAELAPPTEDIVAMHWLVDDGIANVVLSTQTSAADAPAPEWTPISAWQLHLGPDMVVTVGTTVCAAPVHTYDWQNGEFLAVVNRAQDQALGAWTLTRNGPTPYAELAALTCARFVP